MATATAPARQQSLGAGAVSRRELVMGTLAREQRPQADGTSSHDESATELRALSVASRPGNTLVRYLVDQLRNRRFRLTRDPTRAKTRVLRGRGSMPEA